MFITERDRAVLNEAKILIEKVHNNINCEFKEFALISTAIDSIEYAIYKEKVTKENIN